MQRNQNGFTLVEIIVVFLLMSIIAATVMGRSVNTDDIDLAGQFDKSKGHIIYAQSAAMKYADFWGIKSDGTAYWLFRGADPDAVGVKVPFPGEANDTVSSTDVTLTIGTIFFDAFGRPYTGDPPPPVLATAAIPVSITVGSKSRNFNIAPETGFIQ